MAISVVIIIGCVILGVLIGLDIWFSVDDIKNNTWSEIIHSWATFTPIVPFVCGVLSGHFFHPNVKALLGQPNSIALLVWSACLISMVGFALYNHHITIPLWIVFQVGFVAGVFLWPVQ